MTTICRQRARTKHNIIQPILATLLYSSIRSLYITMVRSTTIFRVSDGLPLAASVDDETVSCARRGLAES